MLLMELIESVMWVALGFIPTLAGLGAASRLGFRIERIPIGFRGSEPAVGGYPGTSSGKKGKESLRYV